MSNLVINMKDVKFGGNTLDVGNDNYGVIYNILKGEEDEISVDYYSEDLSNQYKNFYDNGVTFFSLSQLATKGERDMVLKEIWQNLKVGGNLYIWDREKRVKEIIKDNINVLMPDGTTKEFKFSNINPLAEFGFFNFQKTLEKYFEIQEGRICDKIIYIKAKKRGIINNEDTINGDKFKVHPQQSSSEMFKSIHKGFKFSRKDKRVYDK